MANLDPGQILTIVTIIVCGLSISLGTLVPTWGETKIAVKALEGMARQPDSAGQLRMSMIIGMALCETTNIYILLIVFLLLFANPLVGKFF